MRLSSILFFFWLAVTGHINGQTPAELQEKAALEQQLAEAEMAMQAVNQQQEVLIGLEKKQEVLEEEVRNLRQRKADLTALVSDRRDRKNAEAAAPGIPRYDSVAFTSGRTVACSVAAYENRQFKLEDLDGNHLHVLAGMVSGIRFDTEGNADVFPAHVVNKGPIVTRNVQTVPTPTPKAITVTDRMVEVRVSRRKSSESIDARMGYLDEVSEVVQFDCTIESKSLPDEGVSLRLKIWVFAESVLGSNSFKLILSDSEDFTLSRLEEYEFSTGRAVLQYDEKGGGQYGYKLYGWVFVLEDSEGNVILVKRNKKDLEDNLDKIRKMSLQEEVIF